MFVPWDYALDEADDTGSMARAATAIRELHDEDTLLVDAGDTIQDNMAELFNADETYPMIACMNAIGYDIGVTGNHEYNYDMLQGVTYQVNVSKGLGERIEGLSWPDGTAVSDDDVFVIGDCGGNPGPNRSRRRTACSARSREGTR